MSDCEFCHLHLHTQYSLLDASTQMSPLIERVAAQNMKAVAVTDHGNMFGAVEFYKEAKKKDVKPILGLEAYVVPDDHREKTPRQRYTHLVLLALDEDGYRSLCRLVSASYLHGFYRRPRIDYNLLREYNKGLVALSACLRGPLNDQLVNDRDDVAVQEALRLVDIFKPEDPLRPTETARFFVELQDHGIGLQHKCNGGLRDIAKRLGLPMVITNDSHYTCPDDYKPHDVLLCIGQGKSFYDPNRESVYNPEFYVKSPEEMYKLFPNDHEALRNTMHIAERSHFKWKFNQYRFPIYTRPGDPPDVKVDYNEEMKRLSREGLEKRFSVLTRTWARRKGWNEEQIEARKVEYLDRLETELDCIVKMGFAGYFLIVQDFINWAKDQDIPVGPGRGSAAGSLVAYCMRITDIDPMEFDLLFQRFLNPERISMPDVDVDFCMRRREEVIKYVHRRYGGDDKVCQIITFGKMLARGVIKDVGRAMELPYAEVDKLAKMVPEVLGIKLKDAIAQESRFKEAADGNPKVAELLEYAQRLEGVARHTSMHAAGVVICDVDLADVVPLHKVGDEGVTTQYDMKGSESAGLIKFDFLGLKTLDQIQYASQMINAKRKREGIHEPFIVDEIPIDWQFEDARRTYELLQAGDTVGVFQLESSGMRELVMKLKPSTIEDVIALVALYRPGPLQSGMVDDFVDRKHGRKEVSYPFPQLEGLLSTTYGVIVYQEQVMLLASVLANYSLGEADLLRRAMGKKDAKEMGKQKDRFLQGCEENKLDLQKASDLFDLVAKFAEYGFNKSHSAAYGYLAYQTAYLKANYRAEFFAALLSIESDTTDKVFQYISDARDAGLEVVAPNINKSDKYFSVDNGKIVYGLVALKGVGEGAVETIIEARSKLKNGFKSLSHFCEEVDLKRVNKKVIENLVKSGAFDNMGDTRAAMISGMELAVEAGASYQKDKGSMQVGLFGASARTSFKLPVVTEWPQSDKLTFEKEALGFYLSGHPMGRYQEELKRYTSGTLVDLADMPHEKVVTVAGTISSRKVINTKKGDRMAFLTIEDMVGSVEVLVFPRTYAAHIEMIGEDQDQPLVIKGKLDNTGESPKLLAETIELLSSVREANTRRIVVRVNLEKTSEVQLKDLEKILRKYPGNIPVELHFWNLLGDELVRAVVPLHKHAVTATEAFQQEIERLFGESVAVFQ